MKANRVPTIFDAYYADMEYDRDSLISHWEKCRDAAINDKYKAEIDELFFATIQKIDKRMTELLEYTSHE